jgi:hypothetical protein
MGKHKYLRMMRHNQRDHAIATLARIVMGAVGVLAGVLFVRSVPDLIRYAKLERM